MFVNGNGAWMARVLQTATAAVLLLIATPALAQLPWSVALDLTTSTLPATTGTITGQVRWMGSVPPPVEFEVRQDEHTCAPSGKLQRTLVKFDPETRGLAGVVVYFEQMYNGRRWTEDEIEAEHVAWFDACEVHPSVLVLPIGGNLTVRNEDDLWHLMQVPRRQGDPVELELATNGSRRRARIETRGPIRLECSRHMWEFGYVFGADHPYVTTTDAAGNFRLDDIPPGSHRIRLWHQPVRYTPIRSHGRIIDYQPGPPLEAQATISKPASAPISLQIDFPGGQSRPMPE